MEFKIIAIAMVVILVLLFTWSHFYSSKAKKISKLEVDYFEALKSFERGQTEKAELLQIGKDLSLAQGKDAEFAHKMVSRDISSLSQTNW